MKKLNVAIIGQGRSGRDIHGKFLKSEDNTFFNVKAVVEIDPDRRALALEEYPGCEVFESYTQLYGRDDIDMVVNATISKDHYAITKDLLSNGFNVITEKPFARNRYECDTLINIANEKNVKLGVFHQSLFAPFFVEAKKLIKSGKLGDIKQVDITYNGFGRRWDWQAVQLMMGGAVFNTGPHPIGYALSLLDWDPNFKVVFSKLDTVMTSGDAEDYAKIIITAPNKPVIDLEINSNDAHPAPLMKILGSKGTYSTNSGKYDMKYIVDGENPEQKVILEPMKNEKGLPAYCSERLITHEESGDYKGTAFTVGTRCFYEMMYNAITKDEEMEIKPEYAAMAISVIEQVHAQNPLPVKF